MKRKSIVPSAEEVARQGEVQLDFGGFINPADRRLPRPLGASFTNRRNRNLAELLKLQATRERGGLIADDGTHWIWACTACAQTYKTEGQAWHCCRAEPRLVRVCVRCDKAPELCRCSERKPI